MPTSEVVKTWSGDVSQLWHTAVSGGRPEVLRQWRVPPM